VTICCPGPISGPLEQPRRVFGPSGWVTREAVEADRSKRLGMKRCTELVLRAAAHGVGECWIAKQPVLGLGVYLLLPLPPLLPLLLLLVLLLLPPPVASDAALRSCTRTAM
jgi:hypothetical protein